MSSLTPTEDLGLSVCVCVSVCVSQVISNAELRATVFLDLCLPVSPVPSDAVTLRRDGEETREGGSEGRREGGRGR